MKLVVFCLLAVCCYTLANASANNNRLTQRRKLLQIINHMKTVQASLQLNGQMLHTPPNDITDCCCLTALRCFRANLQMQFDIERNYTKFYKALTHNITEEGMTFCDSGNKPTCQDCHTHPKKSATEFFDRMRSLFQRAITRLSMD